MSCAIYCWASRYGLVVSLRGSIQITRFNPDVIVREVAFVVLKQLNRNALSSRHCIRCAEILIDTNQLIDQRHLTSCSSTASQFIPSFASSRISKVLSPVVSSLVLNWNVLQRSTKIGTSNMDSCTSTGLMLAPKKATVISARP